MRSYSWQGGKNSEQHSLSPCCHIAQLLGCPCMSAEEGRNYRTVWVSISHAIFGIYLCFKMIGCFSQILIYLVSSIASGKL